MFGALMGVCVAIPFIVNKGKCLHCGKGSADYCEKCYQDLISENLRLQLLKNGYEQELKNIKKQADNIIGMKNTYIAELEHIRDCYYLEKARREEQKKMFRKDKGNHIPKID